MVFGWMAFYMRRVSNRTYLCAQVIHINLQQMYFYVICTNVVSKGMLKIFSIYITGMILGATNRMEGKKTRQLSPVLIAKNAFAVKPLEPQCYHGKSGCTCMQNVVAKYSICDTGQCNLCLQHCYRIKNCQDLDFTASI